MMAVLPKWDKKYWFLCLLMMTVGLFIHIKFWQIPADALQKEDIYYIWLEGKRIILGENPYTRVLAGNLRDNDKYATYFPLIYLLSALVQKIGLTEFRDWLYLWRPVSWIFHMGIIGLTLSYFHKRGLWILGCVTALILLLGRWSLYIINVHHLEFAAIFCLLLSLILLKTKPRLAFLMFSLSLGIKQIAIFLLPLYLIQLWKNWVQHRHYKDLIINAMIIVSVPLLTSLPFLFWNAEGFFKSIFFSATREASSHIRNAASIDVRLSQEYDWVIGLRAKLPMLFLMGLLYLSFIKEKVSLLLASTMTMMTFLYFNSVLFLQYFVWPLCLMPFAFVELIELL